jgi:6-phosphofructokinase 1
MGYNIGVLTAGGDSPGLNAAIRAIGKTGIRSYDMQVIGFRDGFRGLMQNRFVRLDSDALSGILTTGGTILGTSRDKPHRMNVGGQVMDVRDLILENVRHHQLDALVCIGGGGTQKNALRLSQKGIPVVTLPKTIDNDVWGTDATFGFDTALGIATAAIDRLHSTAHSHHRIVVVEIMGHNTGWLALGAGLAGGADVILTPEIPYDIPAVAESILRRKASGSPFSIVAVSEGAMSREDRDAFVRLRETIDSSEGAAEAEEAAEAERAEAEEATEAEEAAEAERAEAEEATEAERARADLAELKTAQADNTVRLARRLEELTMLESRVTILGHVQRGGTPSPVDRLLATRLGAACAEYVAAGETGIMVASQGNKTEAVPLEEIAGKRKVVPPDHRWIRTAERLGINLGRPPD